MDVTKLDPRLLAVVHMSPEDLRRLQALDRRAFLAPGPVVTQQPGGNQRMPRAVVPLVKGALLQPPATGRGAAVLHGVPVDARGKLAVFLKAQPDFLKSPPADVEIRSVSGDIATALVSVEMVKRLAGDGSHVSFIELSRPAKQASAPIAAAKPAALPSNVGFTGKGTVIGIIDSDGLDVRNESFLSAQGTSRLRCVWNQRAAAVRGGVAYGADYAREEVGRLAADPGFWTHDHGTSVALIAAGRGSPKGSEGVAPDADIVFVNTFDSGTAGVADFAFLADALDYIFKRAGDQPCVVNISLGDNLGAHDGTCLFEQFIQNKLAEAPAGKKAGPGRAVVVAAGNERDQRKQTSGEVSAGRAAVLGLVFPKRTPASPQYSEAIQIWYPYAAAAWLELTIVAPAAPGKKPETIGPFKPKDAWSVVTSAGGASIVVTSVRCDGRNSTGVIEVLMIPLDGDQDMGGVWSFNLSVGADPAAAKKPAKALRYAAWIDTNNIGTRWNDAGTDCTVTVPGTARSVITVGGYGTDKNKTVLASSGSGPARNGTPKPDLVAIASVPDPLGGAARSVGGTSYAAPQVAGAVALLFEETPTLQPGAVMGALKKKYVEEVRDPAYGVGRLRLPPRRT